MVRVLDKKLSKVLDMRTDSPQMLDTLTALSSFYGKNGNTLNSRKSLRSDLEKRNLMIAEEFISKFEPLIKNLERIESSVVGVKNNYDSICKKIKESEEVTSLILHETESMQSKRDALLDKANKVESFLSRFQLSEGQREALYDAPIDSIEEGFFPALSTVQRIREDCTLLLGTSNQSVGMELLEEMSSHQEVGFERLYKWTQEEIKKVVADTPDINRSLRGGLKHLRERQAYFKHCQELFVTTRRNSLVRRFILALTRGGPGGIPRPIELQSHDPIRYVGDMLAWVHQAVAGEKELFDNLYANDAAGNEGTSDGHRKERISVEELALVDEVFNGIIKPLTVRIDQVLSSHVGLVLAYKLSNIFSFYTQTISSILGGGSLLTVTFSSLESRSTSLFQDLMNSQTEKLVSSPPQYPADLSPPHAVGEVVARLSEILQVYSNSMTLAEEKEAKFKPILDSIYDPLQRICEVSSEGLDITHKCIFLINTYYLMQQALLPYDFVTTWVTKLATELHTLIDLLVEENHRQILLKCGVSSLMDKIKVHSGGGPLSRIPGLDSTTWQIVVRSFTTTLFALVTPQFDNITSPKFRNSARSGVAQAVIVTYEHLFSIVSDPSNQYENIDAIFLHTPDQIKTLLA